MKYTKKVEQAGDASITEHIVEGDYEEVLAIFTEMNAKDAVEYRGFDWASITNIINQ